MARQRLNALLFGAASASLIAATVSASALCADKFVAVPFIAAGSANTTELGASLANAPGNPFLVSTNVANPEDGTYSGILITPANNSSSFQSLSFAFNGPKSTNATVHYKAPGQSFYSFATVAVDRGIVGTKSSGSGYDQVYIDYPSFGIPAGSHINKIVLSSDPGSGTGNFLVTNLQVNGVAATRSVKAGTKFFHVVAGTGSGPLEHAAHGHLGSGTGTTMSIYNNTANPINVYMTSLGGAYASGANVPLYYSKKGTGSVTVTQDPDNGKIGYFTLNSLQKVYYLAGQSLDINIYCPITGASPADSQCFGNSGATFAEVNINNSTEETVDISEVNGVNTQFNITLTGGSASYRCTWSNGSYLIPSGPHKEQYIPITSITNYAGITPTYYGDYGNPGVFPFGCTNCESRYNAGVLAPGCSTVTYPSNDVGCDNAINPYNPGNTSPPPNIASLPADYYSPYKKGIFPTPNYGICTSNRTTNCGGGNVAVSILQYPFTDISPAASTK